MEYYISVVLIAVSAALTCFISLPTLKILQLSGYKARGVIAWLKATAFDVLLRYIALMLFSFVAVIVFIGCFGIYAYARYCAAALYVLLAVVFIFSSKGAYKDIRFTGRLIRLMIVQSVLGLGIGALMAWLTSLDLYCQAVVPVLAPLAPLTAVAADYITYPFEKANNAKYVKRAKRKLGEKQTKVIGITGSFGKTTAKNILKAMIETERTVLATPSSYNTPMGVCKTINNSLDTQEFFIAELGARYRGDISELCGIVAPMYGIITAIGDMHIATFGSRAAVADTKFELAAALPENGFLALNGYNEECKKLCERETRCQTAVTGEVGQVSYKAFKMSASGSEFDLVIDGTEYPVRTELLGAHIPELACVCAEIALKIGISPEHIAEAVSAMPAVEHRLQLLSTSDPSVTVIDDAYNSNPVGARNALNVLSYMNGKKVIITPGFVELGAIEKENNIALGAAIAEVCDYAFLVGSRAEDIKKGALKAGMNDGVIEIFASRDDAVTAFSKLSGEKAVLFENDLPDNIK